MSIRTLWFLLWALMLIIVRPGSAIGLEPAEIMIVANRQSPEGVELARYYAHKRGIPELHLLLLNLPAKETCSRDDYERRIAGPVRETLAAIRPPNRIRCLVLFFGIPLRVRPAVTAEAKEVSEFKARPREP